MQTQTSPANRRVHAALSSFCSILLYSCYTGDISADLPADLSVLQLLQVQQLKAGSSSSNSSGSSSSSKGGSKRSKKRWARKLQELPGWLLYR
jgi:hypothetical protein